MDKTFNYDFLKLEFRDLYDDLENLKAKKNIEELNKSIDAVISDIIYSIYKKNRILYDEKLPYMKRLEILKEINTMPEYIFKKINRWISDTKRSVEIEYDPEHEIINLRNLYEILVWFVINYGKEDYSLIADNLLESEKDIFKKYLPVKNRNEEKNDDEIKYNPTDVSGNEEVGTKLLEKGENYYFGRGVRRNEKKAYKYFLDAARFKNEYAESYLGLFYEKGIGISRNYEIAYQWYYKAANKGNPFAQYSLGVLFSEGNGVVRDHSRAFIWFQKSAENDYVAAYYQLARAYYSGLGVEVDLEKAFKWHQKAAENDFPASQYALSLMYKNGEGCEPNVINAYYWVEKAAENDYEDAYYIVGRSYLEGIYVDPDYKKAFHYLNKGYRSFDTNCIESLAEMYLKGLYVKKDIYTALELYNKAIEFGDLSLYFKVGKIYEDEGLVSQAISIYEQGHDEGNLKCTQRLGIMYYNAEGVKRNLEKAIEYMEIAAAKKESHAMYVLAVAYLRINKFGDKTDDLVKNLLKEAYDLGSPCAADYLAGIMINDLKDGKEINKSELIKYINFGVDNDLENSIFKMGYIHEKGIGVELSLEKAYNYYNIAAEKGSIKSMVKIGDWYKQGVFLNRNIDLAIKWYEKAATQDNIKAIEKLIEIYEKGIGNRRSDIKAIYYVFKIIDLDALKGKEKLVEYCFKGIGIEENKEKGLELLEEIEEVDKGTANLLKGTLGEEGLIDITEEEIINIYSDGIDLGNLECYGRLAFYIYKNDLVSKYEEAFNIAMEGRHLGVSMCEFVYLIEKLKESEKSSIVTVEELIVVKKIDNLVNKGLYQALNELIKWYKIRKSEDKLIYYELMEEAIYYNVSIE